MECRIKQIGGKANGDQEGLLDFVIQFEKVDGGAGTGRHPLKASGETPPL